MTPGIVARHRAALLPLHGWLGLIAASVIYLVAFTGTLCVFDGELDRWARPAMRLRHAAPIDVPAVQRMLRETDATKGWVILLPSAHREIARATILGADGSRLLFFDSSNGRPIKTTAGPMAYLLALHSRLSLRIWNIGYIAVTAAGLALLALLLSGLFLYPRLIPDLFTLRVGPSLATLTTFHRLAGVFGLPFNIIVALGGLLMLIPILADRPINALYANQTRSFERELGGACSASPNPRRSPDVKLTRIMEQAKTTWPGTPPGRLTYDPDTGTVAVEPNRQRSVSFGRDRLCFDAGTGRLLEATQPGGPFQKAEQLLTGIHLAQYDRLASRLAHFLSGALLCGLIASGLLLWSESRRRMKPARPGVDLVERWAIGLALGLPLATLVYLCVDRFQLGNAFDTQLAFWIAWLTSILAVALTGRRSCRPLLIFGSALSGTAALFDYAVTPQFVPSGVNLALLTLAATGAALSELFRRSRNRAAMT